ncbi:SHOCT domain-containing protein [Chloroflexota bacterium]
MGELGSFLMWYMHELGGWGMLFCGIGMLIFWGGFIALIIWGINRLTKSNSSNGVKTALDIAKERYARGEIKKDEFEEIKKDLA